MTASGYRPTRLRGDIVASGGRYHWLKLDKGFFKRPDVQILEAQEHGPEVVLLYLKLLTESLEGNGKLRFSDAVPYSYAMLHVVTRMNAHVDLDAFERAMTTLSTLGLIIVDDEMTIQMMTIDGMIGGESTAAARMRQMREKAGGNGVNGNHDITGNDDVQERDAGGVTSLNNVTKSKSKSKSKIKKSIKEIRFDRFWDEYPKKVAKVDAQKVWEKLDPDDDLTDEIVQGVIRARETREWRRENGQYIPGPARYLRGERWKDALPASMATANYDNESNFLTRRKEAKSDEPDDNG